jgi:FAD/FMN-containing dehydrogenase
MHPPFPQVSHPCHWRSELGGQLAALAHDHQTTLPFGNGRSYGDSCLAASDHVLGTHALDRFIQADWEDGVLRVEAGVSLEQILEQSIPRGWFLPVTPGTKFITVGGAIANDVHGKNHHIRGTFGRYVRRMRLVRSREGAVDCSPDENTELFCATIGGLGLTGVIEWAEISLTRIRSSSIDSSVVRFHDLREFFALANEYDSSHEFSVAWIDCAASGKATGRGVYMAGNHAQDGELRLEYGRRLTVPVTPPFSLINRISMRAFNEAYWRAHPATRKTQRVGYESFFYPLDRILRWNRIYGRRGFQQYQCLIPRGFEEPALDALLRTIADSGMGSFLAVLKRCGDAISPGLLSFPRPGSTLALDFPQSAELETRLFPRLDAIVREAGGRLYAAKDAHMGGNDFRRGYPMWEKLEAARDPAICSRFWKRVAA